MIALAVLFLLGAGSVAAWLLWPKPEAPAQVATLTVTTAAPTATVPSATTLDVIDETPTATAAPVLSTTATATQAPVVTQTAAPAPRPAPVEQKPTPTPAPVQQEPEPEPTPAPTPTPVNARAYVDGGGDGEVNDEMIHAAQAALTGVKTISVNAGSMQREVTNYLREVLPFATITDGGNADVRIDFRGTFERLGRGKKLREAHATVTRNGRVVFRYELPRQEYRAGLHPAGAFARIMSDIVTE